jgi:hypothetical protein
MKLVVMHVLRDLFIPAVQVADIRGDLRDDFAVHFQDKSKHAVRRRMRRPHVDDQLLTQDIVGGLMSIEGGLRFR